MYVEDVEDRSNTPKGCNAMYVKDGKRTYTYIFAFTYPVLCLNYNVDCNSMSSNYSKIRFKPLIYFELKQSSN